MLCNAIDLASPYNLFRHKQAPDLVCAVRQDRPVPSFVSAAEWEYSREFLDDGSTTLAGFQRAAAAWATRKAGYYLFQFCGPSLDEALRPAETVPMLKAA